MRESNKITIECCTDNPRSCFEAVKGGADRIELCAALEIGGITPSMSMIRFAQEKLNVDIAVMIRPRGGDFLYDSEEFELMAQDVAYCKELGVNSVVLGLLTKEGNVDVERTKRLVEKAGDMTVCFHRAIDMTADIHQAMRDIISCGCRRCLSSGGKSSALEGFETIKSLHSAFGAQIDIMPGGGINADNAPSFKQIGIRNLHLSGKTLVESGMLFRKEGISMGATSPEKEYMLSITDRTKIQALKTALCQD